ncbi:hypothetical protein [Thiohalorhabdus sp.]|uniref:hypothetical protein n=1 Tax=Thiohalorhabdus sp. TaxID=3094134 RepID=UPI002FC3CD1A
MTVAAAEGLPVDRVRRAAMRLLATNQFFLCLTPSQTAPAEPGEVSGISLPNPLNRLRLQDAGDQLHQVMLVSPVTRGPAIPVFPAEAVLFQAALSNGGFDGAVQKAQQELAGRRTLLQVGKDPKPAEEIPAQALQRLLAALRGRKLLNMFRLGIAEPAG